MTPRFAVLVIASLVVGITSGCSSDKPSAPSAGRPTATPTQSPTPAADAPPGVPTPAAIRGDWTAVANRDFRLRIEARSYSVLIGGTSEGHGSAGGSGSRIAFFGASRCPGMLGWYVWSVRADTLVLRASGVDPCDGRTALVRTYQRAVSPS